MTKENGVDIRNCRQHLNGLLNAYHCLEWKRKHPNDQINCPHDFCSQYQDLQQHIYTCQNKDNCYCYVGKQLLIHYSRCVKENNNYNCKLCKYVTAKFVDMSCDRQPSRQYSEERRIKEENILYILQQILHAKNCLSTPRINTTECKRCSTEEGKKYLQILEHRMICDETNCTESVKEECNTVRDIFCHWLNCGTCNICIRVELSNGDNNVTQNDTICDLNELCLRLKQMTIQDESTVKFPFETMKNYDVADYNCKNYSIVLNNTTAVNEQFNISNIATVTHNAFKVKLKPSTLGCLQAYIKTNNIGNIAKEELKISHKPQEGCHTSQIPQKELQTSQITQEETSQMPQEKLLSRHIPEEKRQTSLIPKEELPSVLNISQNQTSCSSEIFNPEELKQALMPTLEKLIRQDPESLPFRTPVDPITLGIPDYFEIVKKPMDLGTVKNNLITGKYSDPWEYVDDVWLMFENAWLYNRKTSRVYRYCTKLSEIFEEEMQALGYCCGRKYAFNRPVLWCSGKKLCKISEDAKYYSYDNIYTFCQKCFNDIPGDTVTLVDDPLQSQTPIKKDQFKEMKNDHSELEPFVHCNECGRKQHQICVLYLENIWPGGFVCDNCMKKKGTKRKENKFSAKRLPTTKLGIYIETRVNNFLKKKEAGAGEVHIRVVSSSDKIVEVKPGMRRRFVESNELCGEFPYRAKALFAFEEVDGVDVCFFGMHVQEYGSECPAPNTRRVYISYLDSVHFFQPQQYRTAVYQEILLGYMDYVKQLGFTTAHIWACPPSEGDDYIFHCHPPDQKIPKPKRLQEWYKKMLDKGMIERTIQDYKDILKQAMEDKLLSAADLPYFEGDFWPNILEEIIEELDEQEEKRKQADAAAISIISNNDENDKKKCQISKAQCKNIKKIKDQQNGNNLTAKMLATMKKHKEVFFVILLHSVQSAASLAPIQDPDPIMHCDLMDGRDAFLTMARDKYYEFSSLRRAQFSTLNMLYELHNEGLDKFVYTCNNCKTAVHTCYHCTVCDDFHLCSKCKDKFEHPHEMEKVTLDLYDVISPAEIPQATEIENSISSDELQQLNSQEAGDQYKMKKFDFNNGSSTSKLKPAISQKDVIGIMVHVCECRDANCFCRMGPLYIKIKSCIEHTKTCSKKLNCTRCKPILAMCCGHDKQCNAINCQMLCCRIIKEQLAKTNRKQLFTRRRSQHMNSI